MIECGYCGRPIRAGFVVSYDPATDKWFHSGVTQYSLIVLEAIRREAGGRPQRRATAALAAYAKDVVRAAGLEPEPVRNLKAALSPSSLFLWAARRGIDYRTCDACMQSPLQLARSHRGLLLPDGILSTRDGFEKILDKERVGMGLLVMTTRGLGHSIPLTEKVARLIERHRAKTDSGFHPMDLEGLE